MKQYIEKYKAEIWIFAICMLLVYSGWQIALITQDSCVYERYMQCDDGKWIICCYNEYSINIKCEELDHKIENKTRITTSGYLNGIKMIPTEPEECAKF